MEDPSSEAGDQSTRRPRPCPVSHPLRTLWKLAGGSSRWRVRGERHYLDLSVGPTVEDGTEKGCSHHSPTTRTSHRQPVSPLWPTYSTEKRRALHHVVFTDHQGCPNARCLVEDGSRMPASGRTTPRPPPPAPTKTSPRAGRTDGFGRTPSIPRPHATGDGSLATGDPALTGRAR